MDYLCISAISNSSPSRTARARSSWLISILLVIALNCSAGIGSMIFPSKSVNGAPHRLLPRCGNRQLHLFQALRVGRPRPMIQCPVQRLRKLRGVVLGGSPTVTPFAALQTGQGTIRCLSVFSGIIGLIHSSGSGFLNIARFLSSILFCIISHL